MLEIIDDRNIEVTRGNVLALTVMAENEGTEYQFSKDDIIRFKIMEAKNVNNVILQKDFKVLDNTTEQDIEIAADEMKIGNLSSKPIDYWFEIELNPDMKFMSRSSIKGVINYEEE